MFAEGAFAAAFVPDYSKRLAADGKEAADRFAADALATMAAATIAITIALPAGHALDHGGLQLRLRLEDPAKFKLAVILTQITMPYLPCMVIAALFAGVLQRPRPLHHLRLLPDGAERRDAAGGAAAARSHRGRLRRVLGRWAWSAGVSQAALCWWGAHRSGRARSIRAT